MLRRGHFRKGPFGKVSPFSVTKHERIGKFSWETEVFRNSGERDCVKYSIPFSTEQIPTKCGQGAEREREADDAVPGPRPRLGVEVDRAGVPPTAAGGEPAGLLFLLLLLLDAAHGQRAAESEKRQ